jgi:hypothetical protein
LRDFGATSSLMSSNSALTRLWISLGTDVQTGSTRSGMWSRMLH